MRATLAAALAILAVAAQPSIARAQWGEENPREVWSASTGISAYPSAGVSGTLAYGRNVGVARFVLAADAIVVGGDGPYNLEQQDGRPVCRDEETDQLVNESQCIEGLDAAVRGEALLRLGRGLAVGPALRFDGGFTPYGALLLERRVRSTEPMTWFAHVGAGHDFLQLQVGVSLTR